MSSSNRVRATWAQERGGTFLSANSVAGTATATGSTTTVVTTAGATPAVANSFNLATITFGAGTTTAALRNQSYTIVTQTATLITTLQTMAGIPVNTDVFTLSGWRTLLLTSQNFKPNFRTVQSAILRSDGNIQDIVRVATDAAGNLPFEMHYGDQYSGIFEMLQAAMRTVADPQVKVADGTQGGVGTNTIDSATAAFTTGTNWQVGDTIYLGVGSSDPGYYRITALTSATRITVDNSFLSGGGWTGVPAPNLTLIRGARMINGVTLTTGDVEIGFLDAPYFVEILGCGVNGFVLDITDEQIMKGAFTMIGGGIADGSTTYVAPVATAAPATNVMSNKVNVPVIRLDSTVLQVKSVGLTINNGITLETVVANQVATGMNLGSFQLTGTMAAYLSAANMVQFHKLVTATEFKMLIVAADPTTAGKGWSFSMPACKFMDSDISTQGLNQPQMVSLPWQAKLSATENLTARFQRFDG